MGKKLKRAQTRPNAAYMTPTLLGNLGTVHEEQIQNGPKFGQHGDTTPAVFGVLSALHVEQSEVAL